MKIYSIFVTTFIFAVGLELSMYNEIRVQITDRYFLLYAAY